ncbi:hypothetical protein BKP45_03405 [Anaerobacillus alkalidiazotrophicus]|uniref:PepSY domain-containing protein n=1 Tax=Anaerobacillus alkalidiazotrophicus TaxID=472963 RepID=A0A1S2MAM3_9BACI|nr:hypothetical protein [Anaerobacillus alkalidiazotrophicus]OIJ21758.1 hypothetical protein BKP45_03405 [Anaerobacillus alkalidiazotrophicus]
MKYLIVLLFMLTMIVAGCTSNEPTNNEEDTTNDTEIIDEQDNGEDDNADANDPSENGDPNDNEKDDEVNGEKGSDSSKNESNIEDNDRLLTEDEAVIKVVEHLNLILDDEVSVVVDREEDGKYVVQVFEVVPGENGVGRTETRGWYSVDRKTGEVELLF